MAENNTGKFKVGDKVKILSYTYEEEPCEFIGKFGRINNIDIINIDIGYQVTFDESDSDGWNTFWFKEKDLELLTDTPETPHDDPVNHPSHYNQSSIECIDAIEAAINGLDGFEGHCTGTSMKYIWRWKWKNGTQDIKKSIWYLQKLLKYEEAKENK